MQWATFTFAGLIFAGMVSAQDLQPEVLLLSRVKNHMNEELRRLATISCLETVRREHNLPGERCGLWIRFGWRF